MLRTLHIRDFVIVEQSEIHFEDGFTVFSGETGAGKSILIDALGLALGARTDTGLIRETATRADISAIFDTPPALLGWLAQHDIEAEDNLVLRRTFDTSARSRAYINGVPVPLGHLRELGALLVDIHGQHAHQSLLNAGSQRDMLDTQGGNEALAQEVRQAWLQWQALAAKLQQAQENKAVLQQERERLAWQLGLLHELGLHEGEWEEINERHRRLAHGQSLIEGAGQALAALDSDEASARQLLAAASQKISRLLAHDEQLQAILDVIESAHIATTEAISDLNRYLSGLDLDPETLASTEQRLSDVFNTARKLGTEAPQLWAMQNNLQSRFDELEHDSHTEALKVEAAQARQAYEAVAAKLGKARADTGKKLAKAVSKAMQTLAMEGGRFEVALKPSTAGPHGSESVEFLVAGHEGVTPRPLAKVASGGELARLSLALSVIASQAARVPTLIFDEVDSGIGGGIAEVVGQLLRELGERHQVLCVTHLPQVAACGKHHFLVQKITHKATTVSEIRVLDAEARTEEIARMLGGLKITETTRRHAREMLGLA